MTPPVLVRDATAADRAAIASLLKASGLPIAGIDDAAFIVAESAGTIMQRSKAVARG